MSRDLTDGTSPWRLPGFRALFTATASGQLGIQTGYLAVPLIAVTTLDASPGQLGVLAALSTVAFLLIGLPAGAWVDRMRHRRMLVAAETARALLTLSIPLAWALDVLTLGQLYLAVLLTGCATVFVDVGSQSTLPGLVGRPALVRANTAVVSLQAGAMVAGRGAGGGLVQLLTAPVAVLATGVLHLAAALRLLALPRDGAPPPRAAGPAPRLRTLIGEGLRHVLGHPELRALVLTAALTNLGAQTINTLLPVVFTRDLGLPAGVLGLYWAAGGVSLFLGARCARALAGRYGYGRALVRTGAVLAPGALLVPLLGPGTGWLWLASAGWLMVTFRTGVDNVLGVTLRQHLTPDALLGRMNATFRCLLTGALAAGSLLGGAIGQFASVRAGLWTGGVLLALACLPVLLSPLRGRRELPAADVSPAPART